jgi:DinB superfamily
MTAREMLVAAIDEAFDRPSWHGTNLRGSIRGLDPAAVVWRPARDRHNIWELVVHAAYWKYTVRRRLTEEKRGSFALVGSNWFERPNQFDAAQWRADRDLLDGEHHRLREAVAAVPEARLNEVPRRSRFTLAGLIRGVAAHDLYHAGQVQLLKKLRGAASRS